jgi:hypothetical protein
MKGTQRDLNQEDGPNHFSFIIIYHFSFGHLCFRCSY